MEIQRVGTFTLGWGESLVWDEQRQRLYFVDCAASTLHWLDGGASEPETLAMPTMPTGVVPTDDGRLVVVLEDGLVTVDPDAGAVEPLTSFPDEINGRCNDACADLDGNIITGKLNLAPGEGSAWQYSTDRGWTLIDPRIANTNGPAAIDDGGRSVLIIGDTAADYFAYEYDAATAGVGERRVFGDTGPLDGHPDGSTVDADNGLWCALFGGAQLARFTADGLDRTVTVPASNPTDVAFGGADMDRLYVVSIGGDGELDGALLVIDGLDERGRPEPRARIR